MSNKTINQLPTALTIDGIADLLPIYTSNVAATQSISRNTYLGITSQPLGLTDVQSPTNKTLGNTNTVTLKDTLFTLQDDGDTTKQAKFQLSGITTATTRTYTLPDVSDTIVTLTASQTLTSKTLTSPTISGGTLDNATVTVDAISGHTTANTGTVYGMSVTAGILASAALVNTVNNAALQSNSVGASNAQAGFVVQVVNTTSGAVATGTTGIPLDDTVPQNTEGDQYMSLAITPKSTTNTLVIQVVSFYAHSVTTNVIQSLFQDSTANALAVNAQRVPAVNTPLTVVTTYAMTAGTTSATTFKVRAGGTSGDGGTLTFNGTAAARKFGGIGLSSIIITEYKS